MMDGREREKEKKCRVEKPGRMDQTKRTDQLSCGALSYDSLCVGPFALGASSNCRDFSFSCSMEMYFLLEKKNS